MPLKNGIVTYFEIAFGGGFGMFDKKQQKVPKILIFKGFLTLNSYKNVLYLTDFEEMPYFQGFSRFLTLFFAIIETQVKYQKASKIKGFRTLQVKTTYRD